MGYNLDDAIRKVPDFPKPGILFYDVTGILVDPEAFSYCQSELARVAGQFEVDAIAAIEARGFVFASPLAVDLGKPLVLIRKKGKLPGDTYSKTFTLEYGEDEVEMHKSDVRKGQRVLILDDLVATGGTIRAAADMIEDAGASVSGVLCVVGLPFLRFKDVLAGIPVRTLIDYESE
jgi:adenine phosphoribosyltransferase